MINQEKRELLQKRFTKDELLRDPHRNYVFECIEHGEAFVIYRTPEEVAAELINL